MCYSTLLEAVQLNLVIQWTLGICYQIKQGYYRIPYKSSHCLKFAKYF